MMVEPADSESIQLRVKVNIYKIYIDKSLYEQDFWLIIKFNNVA